MSDKKRKIEKFYWWNAPIYDATRWLILRGRQAAVKALELMPGQSVLEVGCGTGSNLQHLWKAIGEEGVMVGVDFSWDMLRKARRRRPKNTFFVRTDAAEMSFDFQFDAILMSYSLSMIPDWEHTLAQACRHLKKGGRIVVLDFGRYDLQTKIGYRIFDRYLSWNHVDTHREIKEALSEYICSLEELQPASGYAVLLRGFR